MRASLLPFLALLLSCSPAELNQDNDGDGFTVEHDCNDYNEDIHPDATELCDGVDNNCNQAVDEAGSDDALTWFGDFDGDGFGDELVPTQGCTQPVGYSAVAGDCDDNDPLFHPGAPEFCDDDNDYNCDGSVLHEDLDGDGAAACEDCDDRNDKAFPGNNEFCDGADNDCDGQIDEGAFDALTYYADIDNDDFGSPRFTQQACDPPDGFTANSGDCNDLDPAINPAATEVCDEIDNDCDDLIDDDDDVPNPTRWYEDVDEDGFGDPDAGFGACTSPLGYVANDEDCDDTDDSISPAEVEACDAIDNDCDGEIDEDDASDVITYYQDLDNDSYGDARFSVTACDTPVGYVESDLDCDDLDSTVNPLATETCGDGVDQDCDGSDLAC